MTGKLHRRHSDRLTDFDTAVATADAAQMFDAAIDYYQYAEVGDYYSTYGLLGYEDQD